MIVIYRNQDNINDFGHFKDREFYTTLRGNNNGVFEYYSLQRYTEYTTTLTDLFPLCGEISLDVSFFSYHPKIKQLRVSFVGGQKIYLDAEDFPSPGHMIKFLQRFIIDK